MQQLMMGSSWPAGRVFGIPISIHWSLGLFLAFQLLQALFQLYFPFSLVFVGVVLLQTASILFHELAHAFMARQYGYRTSAIELHAFGGFAVIGNGGGMHDPHQLRVSAAGPLSNLVLWLSFSGLAQVAGPGPLAYGALATAHFNLFIGLFNLLPAYPLDGGSMLLAWLRMRAPHAQASWLAFSIGRWVAAPLALYGLLSNNLLMALVFFIAYQASTAHLESIGAVGGWQYWKARWSRRGGPRELKVDWQKFSPGRKKTLSERIRGWFRRPHLRVTPRRTETIDPDEPRPPTIN